MSAFLVGSELLDALFPPACWLCGGEVESGWFCEQHLLPERPLGKRCAVCALELPQGLADGMTCGPCASAEPPWVRLISLGDYRGDGALRACILALKHGGRRDLCLPLGRSLARRIDGCGFADHVDLLVPVPLHGLRRMQRGYDQALALAQAVAADLRRPVRRCLFRRRPTSAQGTARGESLWSGLGGAGRGGFSRAANVRGAFGIEAGEPKHLEGKQVWLVDDVVTSGWTARECSRLLRAAGARSVSVMCLSRASP